MRVTNEILGVNFCLVASHQAIPAGHNLNASHAHVAIFSTECLP